MVVSLFIIQNKLDTYNKVFDIFFTQFKQKQRAKNSPHSLFLILIVNKYLKIPSPPRIPCGMVTYGVIGFITLQAYTPQSDPDAAP
jgi:hypothetical protein